MSRSCQSNDVLHRRQRIGAHHARESRKIFRQHRVALVRHRRRALLALGEEFFASSTSVRCRCRISTESRSTDEAMTPSVAKYIAWRSRGMIWVEIRLRRQPHRFGDMLFDARVDLGEGAHRA